ncbi:MAG: type VI secretion system tube protein Hcp [Thermomonas sp.]|uniref:Hcp family type VI secretion system effector n=1 Tax=Thermomonas sp. TaxID=1971895 RepID=UPI0039E26F9E
MDDYFLKIDGIEGESQDKSHKNEIQISSISFGVQQTGSMSFGGGGGTGKAQFRDISFSKQVDKATNKITEACAKGAHIPTVVFTARKAGGNPLEYMVVTMNDVIITSQELSGGGGDVINENVSFNFTKIKFKYNEQDEKGNKKGGNEFAWNIKANASA